LQRAAVVGGLFHIKSHIAYWPISTNRAGEIFQSLFGVKRDIGYRPYREGSVAIDSLNRRQGNPALVMNDQFEKVVAASALPPTATKALRRGK
jgi:hypothetical protein